MRHLRRPIMALGILLLGAEMARAHVMPANQGTMAVRGRQVFVALSLPARMFAGADKDRDGRISAAEVVGAQDLLQRLVATRVHLNAGAKVARLQHVQVIVERLDTDTGTVPAPASDLLVLIVGAFDEPPATLSITIDGLDERLSLRAYRDGVSTPTESITLQAGQERADFFVAGWRRASIAARQGMEHIATGPDHLLFLLTLVLAGAGWRYWATVISSFTVAHAIILVSAASGHAPPVPAPAAEVLIALTIVVMAVRVWRGGRERLGREAALAAACGLVHGLGVVDAVSALSASGRADLVTLGSFNAGVEVAQLIAAALLLVLIRVSCRMVSSISTDPVRRVSQATAMATGVVALVWLVARLPQL